MNTTTETVDQLPLGQLHPGDNIRRRLGDLAQLATSIESTGVHEPLIVRPHTGECSRLHDEHWQIVAGHRRAAAAERAGLDTVPCIVRDLDDAAADDVMLIENLQREDLAPLDEATGYLRLTTRGMTITDLSSRIGRTPKHVSGRLELLNLHPAVQDLLDHEHIGIGQAHKLGEALDSDDGKFLLDHLDTDAAERLIREAADSYNPTGDLARAARTARAEKLTAEVRAAAGAGAGAPLVEKVDTETAYGTALKWPKGVRALAARDLGYDVPHLAITEAKHATEPCHAVAVHGGEVVAVCADWHRHKPGGDGHPSAELARDADKRDADKQDREQQRARQRDYDTRIGHLVAAADPRELITAALQHGARQELARQNADVTNRAAGILDLEYGPELHTDVDDTNGQASHSERALVAHAETSQAGAVRVLTVLGLLHRHTPDGLTDLLERYAPALDEEGA